MDDNIEYDYGLQPWHKVWLFGLILEEDTAKVYRLGNYWRPEGTVANDYYIPDDYDTEYRTIDLDHPPTEDVAWDARPLA